jgi:large repetitive protein
VTPTTPTTPPATNPPTTPATNPEPPAPTPPVIQPTPSVQLLHSPNSPHKPNRKGGPRWTFTFATTPGVTYYCRIDKGSFTPCASPAVYRHLTKGRHIFSAKAVDASGHESTVETVPFTVGGKP